MSTHLTHALEFFTDGRERILFWVVEVEQTMARLEFALRQLTEELALRSSRRAARETNGQSGHDEPVWDAARRSLWLRGQLVKAFGEKAEMQELVLSAFAEQRWMRQIDDPLPRSGVRNAKRRLRDVIARLNRAQVNPLIRFRGDGTGLGICWEPVAARSSNGRSAARNRPNSRNR